MPRRSASPASCLLLLAAALLLPCCSHEVKEERLADTKPPMTAAEAAAAVGNPLLLNRGASDAINYNVKTTEELEKIDNGAEGEVYFTNPDNPEEEIAEITAAFENRRQGNGWVNDYGRGLRLARRDCRPIIIWFHDSLTSPKSRALGTQLLETPEFSEWCKDRVVRIKLDAGASLDERTKDNSRYSMRSINGLARRFGLTRKPALAVISANGKVTTTIDGFDDFVAGVEIDLKAGVNQAEKEFAAYKKTLEKRGYRTWHAARGGKDIFARLQRFDEQKQVVYLCEYGGRVSRTPLSRFCKADMDYLDGLAREASSEEQGR